MSFVNFTLYNFEYHYEFIKSWTQLVYELLFINANGSRLDNRSISKLTLLSFQHYPPFKASFHSDKNEILTELGFLSQWRVRRASEIPEGRVDIILPLNFFNGRTHVKSPHLYV